MTILKKNSTGPEVLEVQQLLNELDYAVTENGVFDTNTYNAVRAFQAQHLDKEGNPLLPDGKVGELTWWSLHNPRKKVAASTAIDFTKMPSADFGGSTTGRKALQAAINEIKAGAGEIGGNNKGAFVKKYHKEAGAVEGDSWCASFVSWCYMQAAGSKEAMPFNYTAGARDVLSQFKRKGWMYLHDNGTRRPRPGDVVVWWRIKLDGWKGHIGLVHHCEDGFLYTIEGNKSSKVQGFTYVISRLEKILGFGNVPI
jgi:CHAP domain/Putative peptidoglycan binding domain